MDNLIVDLDGTLCAHGQRVDSSVADLVGEFKELFCCNVIVATASSTYSVYSRAELLMPHVDMIHARLGTHVVSIKDGKFSKILHMASGRDMTEPCETLMRFREESTFHFKSVRATDEDNPYMSFSVLGKDYTPIARSYYLQHDYATMERRNIVTYFNLVHSDWRAFTGGQTGIDVVPKEYGKQTVFDYLSGDEFFFIGDDASETGGDRPIRDWLYSRGLHRSCAVVSSVEETKQVLRAEIARWDADTA